jgi:hypothetical protein
MKTPLAAKSAALSFIWSRSNGITAERYRVAGILRVCIAPDPGGLALTVQMS